MLVVDENGYYLSLTKGVTDQTAGGELQDDNTAARVGSALNGMLCTSISTKLSTSYFNSCLYILIFHNHEPRACLDVKILYHSS
jgi:hypothetical protein